MSSRDGILKTVEYKGRKYVILADDCAQNPRTDANPLWQIYSFDKDVQGGGENDCFVDKYEHNIEELKAALSEKGYVHDLYIYGHGGVYIGTRPSVPAGGVFGFGFLSFENVKLEQLEDKTEAELVEYLTNEVEELRAYINGECYGYILLDKENPYSSQTGGMNVDDSCFGFYSIEDAEESVQADIDRG